ncbi:UNVERIFIED_CONTAM: hypothetical protein FKN15_078307 [Acipenser sinensis]
MNSCFRSPSPPVRALGRRSRHPQERRKSATWKGGRDHGAQRHQPRREALWQSRIGQRRLPSLTNGDGMERTKGGVAQGSVPSGKSTNGMLRDYAGGVTTRKCWVFWQDEKLLTCVQFHPSGQVIMTAWIDQSISLFQVDGKANLKIQSIHLETFPVYKAHFSADGEQVIATSMHNKMFYVYDMMGRKIIPIYSGRD